MKSDATSGISGAAGTPLAYQAIRSGRDSVKRDSKIPRSEAISDSLETSDREGDGRQAWNVKREEPTKKPPETPQEDRLDLIG